MRDCAFWPTAVCAAESAGPALGAQSGAARARDFAERAGPAASGDRHVCLSCGR